MNGAQPNRNTDQREHDSAALDGSLPLFGPARFRPRSNRTLALLGDVVHNVHGVEFNHRLHQVEPDWGRKMPQRSNVVVVDPQPLLRHGVTNALAGTRFFNIVGQGATAGDAVSLAATYTPELIVMDISLNDTGLEVVERVTAASPKTRTIVLTSLDDRELVESAFHAGVSGYLLKSVEVSELCQAASAVIEGEVYVSQKLMGHLFKNVRPAKVSFSLREEQILRLLSRGMSNKRIAFELSLSKKTAKYYLTTLMKKLHAKNRVEVALFAAARKTP